MGRYLKSRREKWFYARFSAMFERMLSEKTRSDSGNFSSKEQVFDALEALSGEEDACFRLMASRRVDSGPVSWAVLDKETSARGLRDLRQRHRRGHVQGPRGQAGRG